jgi:hypothetical protein
MYIYEKKGRYVIDFQDVGAARAKMPDIPVDRERATSTKWKPVFRKTLLLLRPSDA